MKDYALGIDIGGTSAKLALVRSDAGIVAKDSVPCDPESDWRGILDEIARIGTGLARGVNVRGAGIGCAGCVDVKRGILQYSPNLPRWKMVPLKSYLGKKLGMRCVVDNDVNMMALGEFRHGAARGSKNVCCLTIGTGVGGGLIFGGKIYRGSSMTAGELGHVPVAPNGVKCNCGNRGCVERYIGKEGIVRIARGCMRNRKSLLRSQNRLTPLVIQDAARKGDPAAVMTWEKAGYYLGLLLVGVVNALNPDVIVIGGGIANAGALLLGPARRLVRERALRLPAGRARIVRSALGEDAGAVGCASTLFVVEK